MSITIKCATEYRPSDEQLVADHALTDFIAGLPAHAKLSPITVDKGNQRDPWPVMVGLRATWEDER